MKKILTGLIRFYQRALSPLKRRPCCKYYPTCSSYAIDAINEWGALRGSALAVWRVMRCNPFSRGGIDYVPKRYEKNRLGGPEGTEE